MYSLSLVLCFSCTAPEAPLDVMVIPVAQDGSKRERWGDISVCAHIDMMRRSIYNTRPNFKQGEKSER